MTSTIKHRLEGPISRVIDEAILQIQDILVPRPYGPTGNVLPASAISACAVTHTGVWAPVRE